jgi:hypothetical protein
VPDLDVLLREHLDPPSGAPDVVPPPLALLRRRAARRRAGRTSLIAAGAAAVVAVAVAGPGLALPGGSARDTAGYASGLREAVLDTGEGPDGPWRLEVTDGGTCLRLLSASRDMGACDLSFPGRLSEASQFPTHDGDEYVVVVAGPAPPGTARVEVTGQGVTAVATTVAVDGRLFWSARLPPGGDGTRGVAYDASGAVLDELLWPPVPDPPSSPAPPVLLPAVPLAPTGLAVECERAYQQQVGREYPDTSQAAHEAFLRGCVAGG